MKATCWTKDSPGGRWGQSVRRSGAAGSRASGTWPDGSGTTPEIGAESAGSVWRDGGGDSVSTSSCTH